MRAGPTWTLLLLGCVPAVAHANPTEPGELQNPLDTPGDCLPCHAFPNAQQHAGEPNYSPIGWQGSMMANAARDPVFWAGVAIAAQDDPTHTEDCIRCHSPAAFLEGRGDAIAIDDLTTSDLEGIACDLCHRMIDDGFTPPGNARYVIDDDTVQGKVPKRGPWTYMVDEPNHPWSDDNALQESAQLCGVCHDVTTPRERLDDDGVGLGIMFNEQRTYSEWLNSDYAEPGPQARTCQDCHMPAVEDVAGCGTFSGQGKTHPTGGRRHELVGANRFVTELLAQEYGGMGMGMVDPDFFTYSLERMDEFLSTAATLDVQFPAAVDLQVGIPSMPVTLTNETGHKLPTGYSEGRVMWIEVVATYGDTQVYGSGRWDGQAIEDDPQVRRYEAIAENFEDQATFHLLLNDHWVVDSRIPPRGLSEDVETDPVGDRYALDGDAWPHADTVDYAFGPADLEDLTPDDEGDDALTITVRVLYLINTPEYVDFLAEENAINGAGTHVQTLFEDAGGAPPLVLAQAQTTVPLSGFEPESADVGGGETGTEGMTEDAPSDDTSDSGESGESGPAATGSDQDGCGCAATPDPRAGWTIACLAAAVFRRRRRR